MGRKKQSPYTSGENLKPTDDDKRKKMNKKAGKKGDSSNNFLQDQSSSPKKGTVFSRTYNQKFIVSMSDSSSTSSESLPTPQDESTPRKPAGRKCRRGSANRVQYARRSPSFSPVSLESEDYYNGFAIQKFEGPNSYKFQNSPGWETDLTANPTNWHDWSGYPGAYANYYEVEQPRAVVEAAGYLRLYLKHGVILDMAADRTVRLYNTAQQSAVCISGYTNQIAVVHPQGRVLQYGPRIEVQVEDSTSAKNAKFYPKGVSFTANTCALVYLLDPAGIRTTVEQFHDLYGGHIADDLFRESCRSRHAGNVCISMMNAVGYWTAASGTDNWEVSDMLVQQTTDGLVILHYQNANDKYLVKTSPSNGKLRVMSSLLHLTASLGEESHVFVKSLDRRLHYNGLNHVFSVRSGGHASGFEKRGIISLYK